MTLSKLINELDSIRLEDTEECKKYVDFCIGLIMSGIPWLHHPLESGTVISRCRRGSVPLIKDNFDCKPADKNVQFQRASIPFETVFYGSVGNMDIESGDTIAMLETSKLHRDNIRQGREKMTVSHWIVRQDIGMAIVCHPNVYSDARSQDAIKEMQENYKRRLPDYPTFPELIPEFDKLIEFVSGQFAKNVKEGDNSQYMISAYFAHHSLDTTSGIVYPSVQVKGRLGYNVVLRPDIVKNNLKFLGAEELILCKVGDYVWTSSNCYTDEKVAVSLGVESINELEWIV